jgi:serine kinase of HPr protein (carbohydrate metabolism regulator)
MSNPLNIHGTGLLLGNVGVLIRGASGSGKSVLSLSLLDHWEGRGQPAFLVADDRVDISVDGERLIMSAPGSLAGLIELRGRGIVARPHQTDVDLHLVIDLVPDFIRMQEEDELRTELAGVALDRAPVPGGNVISLGHQILLVNEAIRAVVARL